MASELNPSAIVQQIDITDNDMKFETPCAICITGPSQCGKSTFIVKLIKNRNQMFNQSFQRIIYCQPANLCVRNNPIFEEILKEFPTAELVSGLPDISKLFLDMDSSPKCVIIEDLMAELLNSPEMVHLFTVQIHHNNLTVLCTLHNHYYNSRFAKSLSRNIGYKIFFYNRLDLRELKMISMQISNNPNFLIECFNFLMKKFLDSNAYVLIDGSFQSKMKSMFVRSHILPNQDGDIKPIIFFPN